MVSPAKPTIQVADVECSDAEQLGEIYNGPNVQYTRSAAGPFHSQMHKAVLGDVELHANHHTSSMLIEGENARDLVGIGFQGGESIPRRMVGDLFTNADVFVAGPGVEHLANVLPGQSTFQIFLPHKMLADEIAGRLNRDPLALPGQRYFLRLGVHAVSELINMVEQSLSATRELIDLAPSSAAVTALQKSIVESVADVLTSKENDLFEESPWFSSTGWTLLQARQFFQENESLPISLGEVCRGIGVSKRMLQVAFAEGLGISPMRYLKLRRLNAVRTRLHHTSSNELTVALAAREAGFVDLSRFARDYRRLFGELPSETRRP